MPGQNRSLPGAISSEVTFPASFGGEHRAVPVNSAMTHRPVVPGEELLGADLAVELFGLKGVCGRERSCSLRLQP